jgi:pimeloyl-ACP methyl ester carboxylesterase
MLGNPLPLRCAFAVLALMTGLLAVHPDAYAAPEASTSTIRLAIDAHGEVEARDLLRLVLRDMGSAVEVPEGVVDGKIPIGSLEGRLIVYGLDKLMRERGLGLEVGEHVLILTIDQDKLADHVDTLERALRKIFGPERPRVVLSQVPGGNAKGPPVVLLHGLDGASKRFGPAAASLAKAGYDVYLFTYPNDGRIMTSAVDLGLELRALRDVRKRKISLVTQSMGGLVALAAVELDEAYDGAVERLIACAPPFRGAPMARYHLLTEAADTVRGLLEGDARGLVIFDGLGQASSDLRPGSRLLRNIAASKRRPDLKLSILAGRGEVVPDAHLEALEAALRLARPETAGGKRLALDLLLEATVTSRGAAGGRGDGAVPLTSQALVGVSDRVVLPLNHLDFLTEDPEAGRILALDEVVKRLPKPAQAPGEP